MVHHRKVALEFIVFLAICSLLKITAFTIPHCGGYCRPRPLRLNLETGTMATQDPRQCTPPVVWTIAGSDSGGGAGIQADLHAMHALGTHGCSVITAMTAQNSHQVTKVEYASASMIQATLEALSGDLPAKAIKLGMMGTDDVVSVVADFLDGYGGKVVCDPVMISTSGSRLMAQGAQEHMAQRIFPRADLITPNLLEAEELLGRKLQTQADVEAGAAELLSSSKAAAVLLKGGHWGGGAEELSQDYWTDGTNAKCWLTGPRIPSSNTHGTGCSLSSAVAACLALGLGGLDAVVVAKAYVTQGIKAAYQLGKGPGPVSHTSWPHQADCMPWATATAAGGSEERPRFAACHNDWGVYPVVPTADWVIRLLSLGVRDVQLRIKNATPEEVDAEVAKAQRACLDSNQQAVGAGGISGRARLWVNDHYEVGIRHGAYGVHLGQEDLEGVGDAGVRAIAGAGLRLGVSTHSYSELARALAVRPSYVALGPVFETQSKEVGFLARGLDGLGGVSAWRALVDVPLIAIGGITLETAQEVLVAGADGIAVISAITKASDLEQAVSQWKALWVG